MTAPVNAAAIEAAAEIIHSAFVEVIENNAAMSTEADSAAHTALTAALPFLRAEWETEHSLRFGGGGCDS